MSKTDDNLKVAFTDESQTYIEYMAYSQQATEEGLTKIAEIFWQAAGDEMVHALTHLRAMEVIRKTRDNLKEAAEGESLEIMSMYPKFIEVAVQEGRHEAAEVFRLAFEREKQHRAIFREALRTLHQAGK